MNGVDNELSTMSRIELQIFHGSDEQNGLISFTPVPDIEGLSFPLYLHPVLKIILALSMVLVLVQGSKLRGSIISYLKSPESKLGSINRLIWIDQLNGMFLGTNAALKPRFATIYCSVK